MADAKRRNQRKEGNQMNALTIITSLAVGFIVGVLAETIIDANQIRQFTTEIERLENEKQALIDAKTEVIEIVDNRKKDDNVYHDYFKPF